MNAPTPDQLQQAARAVAKLHGKDRATEIIGQYVPDGANPVIANVPAERRQALFFELDMVANPPNIYDPTAPAKPTPSPEVAEPAQALPEAFPAIPNRLKAMKRWLLHKAKIPHYIDGSKRSGELDSPADIARLGTYAEALAALKTHPGFDLGFAIVAGDKIIGLDADKVLGNEKEAETLALFGNTYIETSPSGSGLHAFYFGEYSPEMKNRAPFECYVEKRYFTVTGNRYPGSAEDVADATPEDIARIDAVFGTAGEAAAAPAPTTPKVSDPFANMPEPKLQAPEALANLLQRLDPDLLRDDWRKVLSCIYLHLGNDGYTVARNWCAGGDKYMLTLTTPHRRITSLKVAEAQFKKVWAGIATDAGFRMGAGAFFDILKKQHDTTAGKFGMSSGDIAKWNEAGRATTHAGDAVPEHVDTPATNIIPFNISHPPGLVGDITRYVHGASLTPIKSFSIAAGLFAMSLLSANRYYGGRMDTGLNLFIICCAPTGAGKDASRKALKMLFAKTPFLKHIWEKAASATGMLRALARNKPHLFALMSDEIGLTLQSYSGVRVHANDKMIMALILTLFGNARQPMSGSAYAKAEDNIEPINNPFLTLFGSSTPETLYPAFNMELVNAGTVNRIVVVGAGGIDPEPDQLNFEIPEQLQQAMGEFERNAGFAPENVGAIEDAVAARQSDDVAVEFAPGAFEYLQGFVNNLDTEGQPEALWGRYREQIVRVATLLAVGDGGTITKDHVTWAQKWIDWCLRNFNRALVPLLTNTDFSKKAQRILEIIQNAKKYAGDKRWGSFCKRGLMPMAKLKKTLPMPPKEFEQIVTHLTETYQISSGKEGEISVFWVPK